MKIADVLGVTFAIPFNALDERLAERMVVFGTGGRGRRCRSRLERLGVAVPFFADNDPAKHGTVVDGAEVLAPLELLSRAQGLPVLVSSWAEGNIVAQLQQLGVCAIFVDGTGEREDPDIIARHAGELDEVLASLADEPSRLAYADALRLRFMGRRMTYPTAYPVYAHPLVRPRKGVHEIHCGRLALAHHADVRPERIEDVRLTAKNAAAQHRDHARQFLLRRGQHPLDVRIGRRERAHAQHIRPLPRQQAAEFLLPAVIQGAVVADHVEAVLLQHA